MHFYTRQFFTQLYYRRRRRRSSIFRVFSYQRALLSSRKWRPYVSDGTYGRYFYTPNRGAQRRCALRRACSSFRRFTVLFRRLLLRPWARGRVSLRSHSLRGSLNYSRPPSIIQRARRCRAIANSVSLRTAEISLSSTAAAVPQRYYSSASCFRLLLILGFFY